MRILTSLITFLLIFTIGQAQDLGPEMVLVEGGEFYMGNDYSANADERPEHKLKITSFFISKYEVNVADYAKFCRVTGQRLPDGDPMTPINNITWEEAVMYCNWLSRASRLEKCYDLQRDSSRFTATLISEANGYRLPTEAEWEYAAKGGIRSKSYAFSGSNDLEEVAWYIKNSGNTSHEVGQKKPNELGLYDMTGNAMEWCYDWYNPDYYENSPADNPSGPESGISKVCRGGNYMCRPDVLRNSRRFNLDKSSNEGLAGIRLVKNE